MNSSRWKTAHASVLGTAHVARETECQDRLNFQILNTLEGEVLVVAMADGAGSSRYSQIGAELACRLFIEQVAVHFETEGELKDLNEEFGISCINYFRQKIIERAEEINESVREFACTFLAAVIGEQSSAFYQIGDGAIVYSLTGSSDSYCFGIIPAQKIYANATYFVTDDSAAKNLLYDFIPEPIEDLAMFTDGVESFAINNQTGLPHEPFLKPMLAPLRKSSKIETGLNETLANFLNSPRINEKTDDDKTLFLASCHIPKAPVADAPITELADSDEVLTVEQQTEEPATVNE